MIGTLYRMNQQRIVELVLEQDPDVIVPACPDWTATDLVRHIAGLAVDVASGNVHGYGGEDWTDNQVTSRSSSQLGDVIEEWNGTLDTLCPILDDIESSDLPDMIRTQVGEERRAIFPAAILGDLLHHEFDLRNAFGDRSNRDRPDVIGGGIGHVRALRGAFKAKSLPTVQVIVDGNAMSVGHDEPVATVDMSAFEALRAIGGRRTIGEILAYPWTGDAEQFAPHLVLPFMAAPSASLNEA